VCLFVGLILIWSLWRTRVFVCWSDVDVASVLSLNAGISTFSALLSACEAGHLAFTGC